MVLDTPIKDEMQGSQPWHWGMQALKEEENWVCKHHQEGRNAAIAADATTTVSFKGQPVCLGMFALGVTYRYMLVTQ